MASTLSNRPSAPRSTMASAPPLGPSYDVEQQDTEVHVEQPNLVEKSKPSKGGWFGLWVAVAYACISVAITLVNKAALTSYHLQHADVLMFFQMVFTLIFLSVGKVFGFVDLADWDWEKMRRTIPLAGFFVGMAASGLIALGLNNVPMYSALRKQTTLIVMIQERCLLGTRHSLAVQLSVITMSVGALIAGKNDMNGTMPAYAIALLACLFTAFYNVTIKKLSTGVGEEGGGSKALSVFELMLYNNAIALPFVFTWVAASGHLGGVLVQLGVPIDSTLITIAGGVQAVGGLHPPAVPSLATLPDAVGASGTRVAEIMSVAQAGDAGPSIGLWVSVMGSTVLAPVLNFVIFLCTRVNSPLTTSVTGDLKNVGTDVVGLFAFDDVIITPLYLLGIVVATLGGVAYSAVKLFAR